MITVFALLVPITLLGWVFAPRLAEQADQFTEQLPEVISELQEILRQLPFGEQLAQQLPSPEETPEESGNRPGNNNETANAENEENAASSGVMGAVLGVLSETVTAAVYLFFVIGAAIFFALTPELYRGGILQLVPQRCSVQKKSSTPWC